MPRRYANGHISATGDPMHFMFGSRVGRRIERRYLRFEQIQFQLADPLHVLF